MLVQCNNCGAPLDGRSAKTSIKCNYCGSVHVTETLPVQQAQVPVGWKPPQVWVAPAQFAAAGQNLAYRRTMAGVQGIIMAVAFLPVVLGLGGAAVAVSSARRATSMGTPSFPGSTSDSWDGKATYRCEGVTQANFTGVTTHKLSSAAEVAGACKLVLTGGTLRATDNVISVRDGGRVELHNVHVVLSAHHHGTVIRASGASQVDLYDCNIEVEHGGEGTAAIEAVDAATVKVHGGKIEGKYVLRAKSLATIDASGGADVHGHVEKDTGATVNGVTGDGSGAGNGAGANDCGCAPHDHACKHRCRKNR